MLSMQHCYYYMTGMAPINRWSCIMALMNNGLRNPLRGCIEARSCTEPAWFTHGFGYLLRVYALHELALFVVCICLFSCPMICVFTADVLLAMYTV